MPWALEQKLSKEADKRHLVGKRKKAYVYGTLAKIKAQKGKKGK